MNYKLSINTSLKIIEQTFNRKFRFPNVFKSYKVIDGTKETTVPIITSENDDLISQGIWGLLPHEYEHEWKTFQKALNTLNVQVKDITARDLFSEPYESRRCLILVTGIYISYLEAGDLQTAFIQKENQEPFTLAGIYNLTSDGFITCSIINTKEKENVIQDKSLFLKMPVIIREEDRTPWLDSSADMQTIKNITVRANEMTGFTTKAC